MKRLNNPFKINILKGIEALTQETPKNIKKLQGMDNIYRLRIGEYRIIFEENESYIVVRYILPRGSAYKNLRRDM